MDQQKKSVRELLLNNIYDHKDTQSNMEVEYIIAD
jgi:hypothetical protein